MRVGFFPALMCGVTLTFVLFMQAATTAVQPGKTVWDGVYTDDQATRGRELYATACASCHKDDLSGDRGPNIAGEAFMVRFESDSVGRVFTSISTRMPADNPRIFKPDQYLDLVAYILQANEFPSGAAPLTTDTAALGAIRVARKGAPAEAPNFSLVHVVGCLTQAPDNGWIVTNASAPVVTRDPAASKDAQLTEAAARSLGSDTFRLMLLTVQPPAVAPHKGSKVEAKGLLMRGPENRLNLTSIQPVGSGCD